MNTTPQKPWRFLIDAGVTTERTLVEWFIDARSAHGERLHLAGHPAAVSAVLRALTRSGTRITLSIDANPRLPRGEVTLSAQEPTP